jgi:uncharacterized protein (UPF0548 family)
MARSPDPRTLATAELTYAEHGATRGALPPGYRHVVRRARLGEGEGTFHRAVDALFTWRMHAGAGLTAVVAPAEAAVGELVVMRLGPPGFGPVVPCRVVWVEKGPRRAGLAYGTLPGHPASGEEAFVVEWAQDDAVYAQIRAFSRFVAPWARLGGPITRCIQDLATYRFIRALRRLAVTR